METVTVELINQKALKLLKDLEELNLIRVSETTAVPKQKLSEQFRGKLSNETAEELHRHVIESRNEWERI